LTRDPQSDIRVLERTVDYHDGAEDRLLEILNEADDRTSLSDELAARIDDWPTRYHLSRERSNLIRPLRLTEAHRVLEIGAGTGAVSRAIGETGARVVALEGALPRARAAAARCRDLDNVEIVCGALEAFDDPGGFDLVCLVGVLEYAGAGETGTDPESFLKQAASHLRPGGTLLVAIENQIGLKYLIGYEEDHLGRPWAGVEGYPENIGVRTFSRRRLGALLDSCGLQSQQWFYPFPDYKLPTVVVADAAYDESDGPGFVDQIVRSPAGGGDGPPSMLCDDRRAHQVLLEAGLGREVANSFLVLATDASGNTGLHPDPEVLAWLFGANRRRLWIRHQIIEAGTDGRRIRATGPGDLSRPRSDGWLEQEPAKDDPFVIGKTVRTMVADACRQRDENALRHALGLWRKGIDPARAPVGDLEAAHPYVSAGTTEVLPPEYFDVCPSNFIVGEDGVSYVDREWLVKPGVDADLVSVRGLWLLARELVTGGGIHPWDPSLTADELTVELGRLVDLPASELLDRCYENEVELLQMVSGRNADAIRADLEWMRSFRPTDPTVVRALPVSRWFEQLDAARAELENLAVERSERARLESEVAHERETVARLASELSAGYETFAESRRQLDEDFEATRRQLTDELAESQRRLVESQNQLAEVGAKLDEASRALDESTKWTSTLSDRLQQTEGEMLDLNRRLDETEDLRDKLREWLGAMESDRDRLQSELDEEVLRREEAEQRINTTEAERDGLRAAREAFERKPIVRLWRSLQGLFGNRH
jgi:SAM-dependent methyltransferase